MDILKVVKSYFVEHKDVSTMPYEKFREVMESFVSLDSRTITLERETSTVVLFCIEKEVMAEILQKVEDMSEEKFAEILSDTDDDAPSKSEFIDTLMISNWWGDPQADHIMFEYVITPDI